MFKQLNMVLTNSRDVGVKVYKASHEGVIQSWVERSV